MILERSFRNLLLIEELNEEWILFGYYNQQEFDHLLIVYQRRLISVDLEECLLYLRTRRMDSNNYSEAAKTFTREDYSRLAGRFKKLELEKKPKIKLRIKKEGKNVEDIILAVEKLGIKRGEYIAMIIGKIYLIIMLDLATSFSKIKERHTKIQVGDKELEIISSRWTNYERTERIITDEKQTKTPRDISKYKAIIKGFTGTDNDMTKIVKELGAEKSVFHERQHGVRNGTVFVEFNNLKDPQMTNLDIIALSNNNSVFVKWYVEGKRKIGFHQRQLEEKNIIAQPKNDDNEMALEEMIEDTEVFQKEAIEKTELVEKKNELSKNKAEEKEKPEKETQEKPLTERERRAKNEERIWKIFQTDLDESNKGLPTDIEYFSRGVENFTDEEKALIARKTKEHAETAENKRKRRASSSPKTDAHQHKKLLRETTQEKDSEEEKENKGETNIIENKEENLDKEIRLETEQEGFPATLQQTTANAPPNLQQ